MSKNKRKRRNTSRLAAAATPNTLRMLGGSGSVEFLAAAAGDSPESQELKRFEMLAYTGGVLILAGWSLPVVVDLSGLTVTQKSRPIFRDHNPSQIVGHSESVTIDAKKVTVEGVISGTGEAAKEVIANSARGFPWQSSIGARVERTEFVPSHKTAQANGRTISGPAYIARRAQLVEISFVAIGADDNTEARVRAGEMLESEEMTFEKWLAEKGFAPEDLSDDQVAVLRDLYDSMHGGDSGEESEPDVTPPVQGESEEDASDETDKPGVQAAAALAELQRVNEIRRICGGGHADVEAKAIRKGWDASRTKGELDLAVRQAALEARYPSPNFVSRQSDSGASVPKVLEAGIRLGGVEPESTLLEAYGEQTLDQADRYRRMGIREFITLCCAADGRPGPANHAEPMEWARAAFSTNSAAGIVSNVANKVLLSAYRAVPSAARKLAKKLSANDFKTHTGYRLTGDSAMEQVGPTGELTHGTISDDSYSYKVNTYGRVFGITRQMIIDDDLGAFREIPAKIGRGAAITLEKVFWTLVLDNVDDFFSAANANLKTGTATALSLSSLSVAVQTLVEQVDTDGNPVLIDGKYLALPPALATTGEELYRSPNLVGGSSKSTRTNVHAGRYEPTVSPYLGSSSFHSSASSTAWYMFADPADVPAFGLAYLNGRETPVVEETTVGGEYLGRAWRGYFDFGVCQVDHRGAVMLTGASA